MSNNKSMLQKVYAQVDKLPAALKAKAFTVIFGRAVKYFRTSGLRFEWIEPNHSIVVIKNRKYVQNHIGTVHAVAMIMIAESATGALVGLNVSGNAVPVIKRMEVDYRKRASGDMRAEAMLTSEQITMMQTEERGEVDVAVTITDAENKEPIFVRAVWAWTPKRS
ncbi:DUF4442 domain-containing protein [Limnobacter sp.]|uniref:DUF4442 domain-containing protein n=1 Tax=Limnobacter sp. TaxID=2003368 RepID=UPI002587A130|nr:DUF4442 domain-containing protein [Limnobacter sp.]